MIHVDEGLSYAVAPMGWMSSATCASIGPGLWDDKVGELPPAKVKREQEAKAICRGCPVAAECLAFAIANRETHGVWAGRTVDDFKALRPPMPPVDLPMTAAFVAEWEHTYGDHGGDMELAAQRFGSTVNAMERRVQRARSAGHVLNTTAASCLTPAVQPIDLYRKDGNH